MSYWEVQVFLNDIISILKIKADIIQSTSMDLMRKCKNHI